MTARTGRAPRESPSLARPARRLNRSLQQFGQAPGAILIIGHDGLEKRRRLRRLRLLHARRFDDRARLQSTFERWRAVGSPCTGRRVSALANAAAIIHRL